MPRPPKKPGSSFSSFPPGGQPPASHGNVDRGLIRPEWKERLKKRAEERAQVERRAGGPPGTRPGMKPKKQKVSKFLSPFQIWAPTPEEEERERRQAERPVRLHETLVPDAERERVKEQAASWARGERPVPTNPYRPGGGYGYGYGGYRGHYPPPPQTPAAAGAPLSITPDYVAGIFDLDKLFEHARELRKEPKFRAMGNEGSIGVISPAGIDSWGRVLKAAAFFGIPESELAKLPRDEVWDKFMKPFFGEVMRVLNSIKPADLTGKFRLDSSKSGAFGLIYSEK